jgi:hypothetical protein
MNVVINKYMNNKNRIETCTDYGQQMFATVSQTLSWSHFIELVSIEDNGLSTNSISPLP